MSEDLFEDTEKNSGPVIDPEKNYFEEYVGEGKKYKDEIAAGRALIEKDLFIEQLKREAEEARQELRSRLSVEEALTKLQERQTDRSGEATSHHNTGEGTQTKSTDVDIDKLVEEKLSAREKAAIEAARKSKEEENLSTVKRRLTEVYGPNYASEVKKKAQELGVSTQFLTEAGAREPNALFKLLEVDNQKGYRDITDSAPPPSRVNTTATTNSQSGVRDSSYYDRLKKEDPKRYWSAQVQNQRHKDALALGERFFQ